MKKTTLALMVSLILMAIIVPSGFAWDQAQSEFDAIREEIPDHWWEYDWDKISELEAFLAKGYDKPDLYAQAQYFLQEILQSRPHYVRVPLLRGLSRQMN